MNPEAPVVGTRTIDLDVNLVLAGQGLRAGARPVACVLAAARRAVEQGAALIRPRFIHSAVPVVGRSTARVELPAVSLEGEAIASALDGADSVVAVVCTIGESLDARVSALLGADPLLALAFDGLGSASCERLAAEVRAEIARRAGAEGKCVTGPLSPGMIGWPLLDAQRELFRLVDPTPLGVVLRPSGQMIPRKTLSFVVGVGLRVRPVTSCHACGIGNRCRYRPDHA